MEHPQLIEAAFTAYLAGLGGWTNPLLFLAGESNIDKTSARIVSYVEGDLGEEEPPTSGNRWADVVVELRTPFYTLTAADVAAGTPQPLAVHQANATNLQTGILAVTLPDLLNAAVANFTVFGLTDRQPMRKQEGEFWSSGWKVRILSCPSAIAA